MHRFALICLIVLAAACAREHDARDDRPPVAAVDRLEARLASQPCIGPLNGWERHYAYATDRAPHVPPRWGVMHGRIFFSFVQAIYDYRPRRLIDSQGEGPGIDERSMAAAFGEYDIAADHIISFSCIDCDRVPAAAERPPRSPCRELRIFDRATSPRP
jgi:hypothetical protein